MPKIKISVDKTKCIGSASCVVIAPKFFDLDDDGKVKALVDCATDDLENLKKAAYSCPVNAITLEETD